MARMEPVGYAGDAGYEMEEAKPQSKPELPQALTRMSKQWQRIFV